MPAVSLHLPSSLKPCVSMCTSIPTCCVSNIMSVHDLVLCDILHTYFPTDAVELHDYFDQCFNVHVVLLILLSLFTVHFLKVKHKLNYTKTFYVLKKSTEHCFGWIW